MQSERDGQKNIIQWKTMLTEAIENFEDADIEKLSVYDCVLMSNYVESILRISCRIRTRGIGAHRKQ
jgi:hypothetical protein